MSSKNSIMKAMKLILLIGSIFSLSYITALGLKSSFLLGAVTYILIMVVYMAISTGIGIAYQIARFAKHPLPGFFSMMLGHLNQTQLDNLSINYGTMGKVGAIMYEFLIMRMDIIVPSGIIFFLLITTTFPSIAANTANVLTLGIIFSVFALSYLLYTILNAFLYAIKTISNMNAQQEARIDDLIAVTLMATT